MANSFNSYISDFNGDQSTDLLWRNYATGENELWYMNGVTLQQRTALPPQLDPNWQLAGSGDFDGDQQTDLIWRHEITGQNALWLMNGAKVSQSLSMLSIGDENWHIEGVGDFNGDRKADLIWRNANTGQNLLWYMDGAAPLRADPLIAVTNRDWHIEGVGDFNRDGQADILWQDYASGSNVLWLMNGSTRLQSTSLSTQASIDWKIQGVGDFNRDGNADILLRNYGLGAEQGQAIAWLMNGSTVTQTQSVSLTASNAASAVQLTTPSVATDPTNLSWQAVTNGSADLSSFKTILPPVPIVPQPQPQPQADLDIDIQLFDPEQAFSPTQWQAINIAAENWERIITRDKDPDAVPFKVVVTQRSQTVEGDSWDATFSEGLAEAYVDSAVGDRTNFSENVDLNGVDYDNRVNWNPGAIAKMDPSKILVVMMHELGHALGLPHELLPLNSLMNPFANEAPFVSEKTLNRLETLGYEVDRSALGQVIWRP